METKESRIEDNNYSIETTLVLIGIGLYYASHQLGFMEFLGGLVGMSLGALLVVYVFNIFSKNKTTHSKWKIFSMAFVVLNLMVFLAN